MLLAGGNTRCSFFPILVVVMFVRGNSCTGSIKRLGSLRSFELFILTMEVTSIHGQQEKKETSGGVTAKNWISKNYVTMFWGKCHGLNNEHEDAILPAVVVAHTHSNLMSKINNKKNYLAYYTTSLIEWHFPDLVVKSDDKKSSPYYTFYPNFIFFPRPRFSMTFLI